MDKGLQEGFPRYNKKKYIVFIVNKPFAIKCEKRELVSLLKGIKIYLTFIPLGVG